LSFELNSFYPNTVSAVYSPEIPLASPDRRGTRENTLVPPFLSYRVHTSLCRTKILRDPPKSPLKRGTLTPVPPFLRGAPGGSHDLCVHRSLFKGGAGGISGLNPSVLVFIPVRFYKSTPKSSIKNPGFFKKPGFFLPTKRGVKT